MSGNVGSAVSKSGMVENVRAVEIASQSPSAQKLLIFPVYCPIFSIQVVAHFAFGTELLS